MLAGSLLRVAVRSTLLTACIQGQPVANDYFLSGISAYQAGDLQKAHDHFSQCLELDAKRTDCMTNLASVLVDLGKEQEAEELYLAVLSVEPEQLDAAYNLALMLQDRRDEPDSIRRACALYTQVVKNDPTRWDAWANLAAAASESTGLDPLLPPHAYQRAIVEMERAHEASPGSEPPPHEVEILSKLYYGYGIQLGQLSATQCQEFAEDKQSLLIGVGADGRADDGSKITDNSVCQENAQNALRTAMDLDPNNAQAEHMLASMTAASSGDGSSVSKASAGYVKALFDDFSDSFDEKLAALGYVVPELVGQATAHYVEKRRGGKPFVHALDAGCGTGLAGPYLRPLVTGMLSGVDLSAKMLAKAATLKTEDGGVPIFDRLLAKDLLELRRDDVLPKTDPLAAGQERPAGVELVTAADVLVYFGDLKPLIQTFTDLMSTSGTLIFSCERVSDEEAPNGWMLRSSGRFAHTKKYVLDLAAKVGGFYLVDYKEIVPRTEYGKPVQGHLFVFARGH